jgi:holo-[acyl-carrier protein] synthase
VGRKANGIRFAVKEAVMKAHPNRRLTFHDIVVLNDKGPIPLNSASNGNVGAKMERLGSGPPKVYVKGEEGKPYQEVRVSISHDGDYATAVCMGVEELPGGWRFRRGRLVHTPQADDD